MSDRPQQGVGAPFALVIAGLVALLGACVLALAPPAGSLDDAFVVLADARAALGEPSAGSIGGAPVESSTSPLDLLLKMALLASWPGVDPLRGAGWLSLVELAAFAGVSVGVLRRLGVSRGALIIGALGLLTAPGLVESASFRLEGPLFGLVWLLAVSAALAEEPRRALAWGALLAWIRPEGIVLGAAAACLAIPASRGRRVALRIACVVLVAAPVTLFRLVTYGSWAPNTYFAKRSDSVTQEWMDGSVYLAELLASPGGVALVALGVWTAWAGRRSMASSSGDSGCRQPVALWLAVTALVVLVASGGDSYAGARLAAPVGIPIWLGFATCQGGPRPWAMVLGASACALQLISAVGGLSGLAPSSLARLGGALGGPVGMEVFDSEVAALQSAERALDGEVLAHRHLQRLRWFCPEVAVLDLTGLTDPEVARLPAPGQVKFGRDAVAEALGRRVGALHLDPVGIRAVPLAGSPLVAALADPETAVHFGGPPFLSSSLARELASHYTAASYPVPGGFVNLIVREDLAPRFAAQGFTVAGEAGPGGASAGR